MAHTHTPTHIHTQTHTYTHTSKRQHTNTYTLTQIHEQMHYILPFRPNTQQHVAYTHTHTHTQHPTHTKLELKGFVLAISNIYKPGLCRGGTGDENSESERADKGETWRDRTTKMHSIQPEWEEGKLNKLEVWD